MGTKLAPAYSNIFMGTLESRILSETKPSPTHWKRYIDDIFLVWTDTKEQFVKSINGLHERINFTGEFSTTEITFLDLRLYKGKRFAKEGILNIKTHIKPTNTQQYIHASSAHPPGNRPGYHQRTTQIPLNELKRSHVPDVQREACRKYDENRIQTRDNRSIRRIKFPNRQKTLTNKTHDAA